jgi:hypothetical protein
MDEEGGARPQGLLVWIKCTKALRVRAMRHAE